MNGILTTSKGNYLFLTITFRCVPALLYGTSIYPYPIDFPREGDGKPVVTLPTILSSLERISDPSLAGGPSIRKPALLSLTP
jgi:hypothetical protein